VTCQAFADADTIAPRLAGVATSISVDLAAPSDQLAEQTRCLRRGSTAARASRLSAKRRSLLHRSGRSWHACQALAQKWRNWAGFITASGRPARRSPLHDRLVTAVASRAINDGCQRTQSFDQLFPTLGHRASPQRPPPFGRTYTSNWSFTRRYRRIMFHLHPLAQSVLALRPKRLFGSMERRTGHRAEVRASRPLDDAGSRPPPLQSI